MRRAHSRTRSPSGVKSTKRAPRLTIRMPSDSSSCLSPLDKVGWVTPQTLAARPKCLSFANASTSSSLSIKVGLSGRSPLHLQCIGSTAAAQPVVQVRLLRNPADGRLPARLTEIDENPSPWLAHIALFACRDRFLDSSGSPCPTRIDARAGGRIGDSARLLHGVDEEIAAGADNDDRQTGQKKCTHDRSSKWSKSVSVVALLCGRCRGLPLQAGGPDARLFFLEPQAVMLLGPVEIDGTFAHGFECAFHADRADISVGDHRGDEQHGDGAVDHLRKLHADDGRAIERKHQEI